MRPEAHLVEQQVLTAKYRYGRGKGKKSLTVEQLIDRFEGRCGICHWPVDGDEDWRLTHFLLADPGPLSGQPLALICRNVNGRAGCEIGPVICGTRLGTLRRIQRLQKIDVTVREFTPRPDLLRSDMGSYYKSAARRLQKDGAHVTPEVVAGMFAAADFRCEGCGIRHNHGYRRRRCGGTRPCPPGHGLSADHNHARRQLRGVLCGRCNWAMRLFDRYPGVAFERAHRIFALEAMAPTTS